MARQDAIRNNVRYIASEILSIVVSDGVHINEILSDRIESADLSDLDRKLLTRLVYGTMQYYTTLSALVNHLKTPKLKLKAWQRELLHVSCYQFYYLDQIPAHAIVNEAVAITNRRGHPSLGKASNAILRQAFRTYPKIEDFITAVARDRKTYLSLTYSMPEAWLAYFSRRIKNCDLEKFLASLLEEATPCIRLTRPYLAQSSNIKRELEAEGFSLTKSPLSDDLFRVRGGNPANSQAFKKGAITIQDEAAALPAKLLAPQTDAIILDACAAPGGKTVQLAEYLGTAGHIWANDIERKKLSKIRQNLERINLMGKADLTTMDACRLAKFFPEASFTDILVDAPCSGLGLFRRKPDIKIHRTPAMLPEYHQLQVRILTSLLPLLKKGGHLVYSTCTITEEENDAVVASLLEVAPNLVLEDYHPYLALPKKEAEGSKTLEIWPHEFASDGFFMARFKKE